MTAIEAAWDPHAFSLTPAQKERLRTWNERHLAERHGGREPYSGASGGRLTFRFTPTSLGVVARASCACGGDEVDLTEYETW